MNNTMKKVFIPFLFCLCFSVAACAQSKDEEALAAAVESFNQALISANKTQLENITAQELSYGHSSGKVQDKAAFVEDVVNGPFDFLTINVKDQTIKMAGNTAIVRHIFTSEATNSGTPTNVNIGNMLVWQKQKGQWKLIGRQAFKI